MDLGAALLQLAAVALGGFIAAMTGRSARIQDSRIEALRLLMQSQTYRQTLDRVNGREYREVFLDLRIALAGARVPWNLINEFQEISLDAIDEGQHLLMKHAAIKEGNPVAPKGKERETVSRQVHPSRFFSRPHVRYAGQLEEVIHQELERPLVARLRRPVTRWRLRKIRAQLPPGYREQQRMWIEEAKAKYVNRQRGD